MFMLSLLLVVTGVILRTVVFVRRSTSPGISRLLAADALVLALAVAATSGPAAAGTRPNLLDDNARSSTASQLGIVYGTALNTSLHLAWLSRQPLAPGIDPTLPIPVTQVDPRVITKPKVHLIYHDTDWNAHNPALPTGTVDGLVRSLIGSSYLDAAAQYRVGPAEFSGSNQASSLCPGTGNATGTDATIEFRFVTCEAGTYPIVGGPVATLTGIPVPDDNTVYVDVLPPSVKSDGGCGAYGGYHAFSGVNTWKPFPILATQTFPYLVIPTQCAMNSDGTVNRDALSKVLSHELLEAATDPIIMEGWIDNDSAGPPGTDLPKGIDSELKNGEAADICKGLSAFIPAGDGSSTPLAVAQYWSNRDNRCVNGPTGRWAYLSADSPTQDGYTPSRQGTSETGASPSTVSRGGTGSYVVSLPRMGTTGGLPQVGTAGPAPGECTASSWQPDGTTEKLAVRCFDAHGTPADRAFTASFVAGLDTAVRFAGVVADRPSLREWYTPALGKQMTSTGVAARVSSRGSAGRYEVYLPGFAGTGVNAARVTAVSESAVSCVATGWQTFGPDEGIFIDCRTSDGTLTDAAFSVVYAQAGSLLGSIGRPSMVALANHAHDSQYNPDPLYSGVGTSSAPVTVRRSATGTYAVDLPVAGTTGGVALVEATANPDAPFASCRAAAWTDTAAGVTVDVACSGHDGAPADSAFLLQYL